MKITINELRKLISENVNNFIVEQENAQPNEISNDKVIQTEDLKNLIIKMAKVRKVLSQCAEQVRKLEQNYGDYLQNNQKRELGQFFYDLDKISSDMKVFRDEFAEQSGLFNNIKNNQPNIEDNIRSILPDDLD
jgi:Mg2+ and Co2+ transporter CorA